MKKKNTYMWCHRVIDALHFIVLDCVFDDPRQVLDVDPGERLAALPHPTPYPEEEGKVDLLN